MESSNLIIQIIQYIGNVFSLDASHPLLFTQFRFWAFFAFVFAGFSLFKNRTLMRNSYLFFASLFFYYKTSGWFVGLLCLVTLTDFFIAKGIYANRDKEPWKKKLLLTLSVVIDLSILCYFKYAYFFVDMLNNLLGTSFTVSNVAAGFGNIFLGDGVFSVDKIILPVGISFYTFQVISYTCDVYRGLIKPVTNLLDFGFYVSFFPQLVAGPIVKASDFIPQLYRKYAISRLQFGTAVFWIMNGLVKKIVLSDYLATNFIDRVFANPTLFSGFENLSALFAYSLQVYADFSGYTDIAIGLSLLMGFHLPLNFNSPYKAPNCSNFWKRWHISLSRWLQNYLYIPLGGNRNITFGTYFWIITITLISLVLSGNVWVSISVFALAAAVVYTSWKYPEKRKKIYANLNSMITMLLGGLWHGASFNFLIWGGLNGVGMIVFKFWRDMNLQVRIAVSGGITLLLGILCLSTTFPLWNLLFVFMLFITLSMAIRGFYHYYAPELMSKYLPQMKSRFSQQTEERFNRGWSILVTFTFITFTRLFFRSGSNLDPAEANETAWKIARDMVNQIGTAWDVSAWSVIAAYHNVFLLFVLGMIIHWLPSRLKFRYRVMFAKLPLPAMAALVVLIIFFTYQFVAAEMMPFIYFQF